MAHESHRHHQEKLIPAPFCYADYSTHSPEMQVFEQNNEQLFSLQAGMEMLGFPSKNHHHQQPNPEAWKINFLPKVGSSSNTGAGYTSDENHLVAPDTMTNIPWNQLNRLMVDDSPLRCLFPSQGNEVHQASQGLSLSLCNPEPSDPFHQNQQQQQLAMANFYQPRQQHLRSSRYLIPAQELLNDFCNIGGASNSKQRTTRKSNHWEEAGSSSSSSWNQQSLYSMDILELQMRKAKLLSMLEEVDRRYKRYCEQMRAVVASFEAMAGDGAATAYSTLASKAMSRHFRCLRDGIVGEIKATKKAMGEKDPAVPGTTKGETPRLKQLDQCLRQQKAFQQAGVIENHPWRPQRGLPERSVSVLRAWLFEHFLHPYPSDVDKHILARQTGLSRSQVSNWFINARVRLWKPMVEEMYLEETKEQDNQSSNETAEHRDNCNDGQPSGQLHSNRNPNPNNTEDQKPLLIESDSLSSIINGNCRQNQQVGRAENYGVVDLDFSSYNGRSNQNFSGGVSLTLGLQQHNGGGMNLSFSQPTQHSLFFSREQMENCQPVHEFSVLDGEAQNNLPYRNLMEAQLMRDLAG